ncbi:unnamed protein product, partial [Strongylus vulgaris]
MYRRTPGVMLKIVSFFKSQHRCLSSVSSPQREKQRGCRARRERAAKRAVEEEERNGCSFVEDPEKPKIRYTLIHDPPTYYGQFQRRGWCGITRFCLGDYITDKVPGFANAARSCLESSNLDIEHV